MMSNVKASIAIPEELHRKMKRKAFDAVTTLQQVAVDALTRGLADTTLQPPPLSRLEIKILLSQFREIMENGDQDMRELMTKTIHFHHHRLSGNASQK